MALAGAEVASWNNWLPFEAVCCSFPAFGGLLISLALKNHHLDLVQVKLVWLILDVERKEG